MFNLGLATDMCLTDISVTSVHISTLRLIENCISRLHTVYGEDKDLY